MSNPNTSTKPILSSKGITKSFSGVTVLEDIDLEIYSGEILALVGENGAGKSTYMKILSGVYQPTRGTIQYEGKEVTIYNVETATRLGISIIHQELNLLPNRTVGQNVYVAREPSSSGFWGKLGFIDEKRMNTDVHKVLEMVGSEVDVDEVMGVLPPAQQQLIEIAKALSMNCKVLFMDEPTSSLSEEQSNNLLKLTTELRKRGMAIVFTTHRLQEAFSVADRFAVFRDGKLVKVTPASETTTEKIVEWMVGRPMDQHYPKQNVKIGDTVLEVHNICGGKVKNASFTVKAGEIFGFAGLVGAGRTELARLIFGADRIEKGQIYLNGNPIRIKSPESAVRVGAGLVPEDRKRDALVLDQSIKENIILAGLATTLTKNGVISKTRVKDALAYFIKRLNINLRSPDQIVRYLSGGNQQKVVLAKWLVLKPKVLIMDEPTRGIDVGAKAEIYKLMGDLAQEGMAIIFISSDLPELLGICDRIAVMSEGCIRTVLDRSEVTPEKIMSYASMA